MSYVWPRGAGKTFATAALARMRREDKVRSGIWGLVLTREAGSSTMPFLRLNARTEFRLPQDIGCWRVVGAGDRFIHSYHSVY